MENKIRNISHVLLIIALLITVLIVGQSILIPAAWALLFAFIGLPISKFLESKNVNRLTASVLATLITMIFMGLVFSFLFYEATTILRSQDDVYNKLKDNIGSMITQLENQFGIQVESQLNESKSSGNLVKGVANEIVALGKNLVTITLIPMYMFFILNYRGLIRKFAEKRYEGIAHEQVSYFLERAKESISNYLKGTLMLTGIATVMTYLILLLFGIKHAFFFALFIAVLNLIPYIGNLIALVILLLFTFLTKDSASTTLFVGIALYVSNLIQENFLRPKFLGDKMEMNAAIVFTSALTGGLIWGVSGLILFIPLTGIVKAFIDSNPRWSSFGVFFESK